MHCIFMDGDVLQLPPLLCALGTCYVISLMAVCYGNLLFIVVTLQRIFSVLQCADQLVA